MIKLSKQEGTDVFLSKFSKDKMQGSLDDTEYSDWVDTFEFMGNHDKSFVVGYKPHYLDVDGAVCSCIEFHFTTGTIGIKNTIRCLQELSELLSMPLVTYISEKDSKLIEFCCKRFGFRKESYIGDVEYDGISYKQYLLTRDSK